LSTLLVVLPCLLRRMKIQQPISRARSRRKPTIEPITIPAIAPPLNPEWEDPDTAPVFVDVALVEDDVGDENRFDMVEKTGRETP
jgi:hypothetical protein